MDSSSESQDMSEWIEVPGQDAEIKTQKWLIMAGGGSHAWWYVLERSKKGDNEHTYTLGIARIANNLNIEWIHNKWLESKIEDGLEYVKEIDMPDPDTCDMYFL